MFSFSEALTFTLSRTSLYDYLEAEITKYIDVTTIINDKVQDCVRKGVGVSAKPSVVTQ